jgi:dUTP pyrophosphatase
MKIMLDEGAKILQRAYPSDAGLDLCSREEKIILQGESEVFDTGVHVELPLGTFGKLESKSGLHFKYNVVCLGGVVDESYRGSIRVKLTNFGDKSYMIRKGQKIVQLVIIPCHQPRIDVVDRLEDTDRGSNGFGSSGL